MDDPKLVIRLACIGALKEVVKGILAELDIEQDELIDAQLNHLTSRFVCRLFGDSVDEPAGK